MMFSVVVPLLNCEHLVERTLATAFAQTFSDFELIVVDSSSDGGAAKVEAIGDPRLKLLRQPPAGPGAARSAAMRASRGEWIAFLDADDYWFPDHLAELAKMAERFPEAGLLATSHVIGRELLPHRLDQSHPRIRRIDYFCAASRNLGVVWTSAAAVRRSVAQEVGDFSNARSEEDEEYWLRMALAAPVIKSDRITAYYFRHADSLMANVNRSRADEPAPETRAEVSAAVARIERMKDNPEHAKHRVDLQRLQRRMIWSRVAAQVAQGKIDEARRINRLLPGFHFDNAAALSLALMLPASLLRLGVALRRAMRNSSQGKRPA